MIHLLFFAIRMCFNDVLVCLRLLTRRKIESLTIALKAWENEQIIEEF